MATITKVFLCILMVLVCGCSALKEDEVIDETSHETYRRLELDGKEYKYNTHLVNFLILGTDTYDGNIGQSDFLGLLIFDRQNEELEFLTLSRNAYVPIKTYDAEGKFIDWSSNFLALSYSYGTDQKSASYLSADAVSKLLNDIPMTYIASMDLNSIQTIHEVVGTVDVVIPDDSLVFADEQWTAGTKLTLTSENVEKFVRTRDTSENFTNVNRMSRQKTYLLAYIERLHDLLDEDFSTTSLKLEEVLEECFTNFDLSEVEAFAKMLMTYKWDSENFYELPGSEEKGMFHDKFIVDEKELERLIVDLFYIEK